MGPLDPQTVYNLVSSNPQARAFVESIARMQQLQAAVQQMQAAQQNTAQGVAYPQQTQTAPQQTQQGGQPQMNALDQAMAIVGEFRQCFETMNKNQKEMYNMLEEMRDQLAAMTKKPKGKKNGTDEAGTDE